MADKFQFKINSRVKLTFKRSDTLISYLSIIQDVQDTLIGVDMPIEKGIYVTISDNEEVLLNVFDTTGLYEFNTKVAKKTLSKFPLLYLYKPAQIKRFENRQFPRIKTYLTVDYQISLSEGVVLSDNIPQKGQVSTRDISVGGCCLVLPFDLPKGIVFDLEIEVPKLTYHTFVRAKVQAEICRTQKDAFSENYFVSTIFTKITEDDRRAINDYVNGSLNI